MFSFGHKNIPTTDLYFREPLKQLISENVLQASRRPIRRLGPYSFFANGRVVIIRYLTRREHRKIQALKPARCYYLVDDDFAAAARDATLPRDYRDRLARFVREQLPAIVSLADTIVAPNRMIHRAYRDKTFLLLNPSYSALCPDFSHFERAATITILFSGTRSHLADLQAISGVMADICRRHRNVRFTTFMGNHAPENLPQAGNIRHLRAQSWPAYLRILKRERFHIVLAPCRDTPFNRARSINKIHDCGAFGAAGLYSHRPPISGVIADGQDGLLLDDRPESWHDAVEGLVGDIQAARPLAEAGRDLAARLGDRDIVRGFWMKELFTNE